ncbi:NADH-quinone oxidoreductase subunit NuoB [Patulibacter sp. SYSU D01012]|uniref:NADH-quinone oxidoreductase subunit B n=1 Tax=Patulibacter sp. SYSU D01012 TaxID=2817381 RepID=UPI0024A641D5|nr:NADH-quinone oxidoreductase subunit NuoB [Patulibacter sp. SYSU D01012]
MEVIRHGSGAQVAPAGDDDKAAFRARQLRARDMLRGELEGADLEEYVRENVVTTTLDKAARWAAGNSFFPLTFGLACCSIDMIGLQAARMDISRFGAEAMRGTPRQADLIILAGRVSMKMAPVVRRIYDQMLEPKYAIAMGACSSSMGVFNNYAIVPADKFLPVDVHVPGCPPRTESLMYGILKLREMVLGDPDMGWRDRYGANGTEERPKPWSMDELETRAEEARRRDEVLRAREASRA